MKKSQFLRKAWKKINTPDKWVQYTYDDGHGRYCMVGALGASLMEIVENDGDDAVCERVENELRIQLGGSIENYNDSHTWSTLKRQVMKLLHQYEAEEAPPKVELIEQKPKVVRRVKELAEKQVEKEVVR